MNYQPVPTAESNVDERASKFAARAEVSLICEIRQGSRPWKLAHLEDISQAGFRIGWLPGMYDDKPIRIRIPGLQMLSADIRWRRDNALGCSFTAPLHVAVFEHIARQADAASR